MSLSERLDKIRSQPKLQNQQQVRIQESRLPRCVLTRLTQTAVVLSAVEDTLKGQHSDPTPTAYFAALLSLLAQYISSSRGIVNKE
ncbi:hypothetical protein LTR28_013382, partial [Elasticomyces elasticus]